MGTRHLQYIGLSPALHLQCLVLTLVFSCNLKWGFFLNTVYDEKQIWFWLLWIATSNMSCKNILHPKFYVAAIRSCLDNCGKDGLNSSSDTQRKPRENPLLIFHQNNQNYLLFSEIREYIYICQGEWGFSRAGERRGRKFPTPTLLPSYPPSPVLTLHSPHSWAEAKLTVPSATSMPAHRARQVFYQCF